MREYQILPKSAKILVFQCSYRKSEMKSVFKWRHYQADIILFSFRWYTSTALTYRQLANMLKERSLAIIYTTDEKEKIIPKKTKLRQFKYLNNITE